MKLNKKINVILSSLIGLSSIPTTIAINDCVKNNNLSNSTISKKQNALAQSNVNPFANATITSQGNRGFGDFLENKTGVSGFVGYETFTNKNQNYVKIIVFNPQDPTTLVATNPVFKETVTIDKVDYKLVAIGANVFKDCVNIKGDITFNSSIAYISGYAFSGCTGLSGKVIFGDDIKAIGEYAFNKCANITYINSPKSLRVINDYAFEGCSKLKSINTNAESGMTFEGDLVYIGDNAFQNCVALNGDLYMNNVDLKYFGEYAFAGCIGINGTITLPIKTTELNDHVFDGCTKLSGAILFPFTLKRIGNSAFKNCISLEKILMRNNVEIIEDSAFENCSNLKALNLGEQFTLSTSLKSIGNRAFYACSKLTADNLNIPSSVEIIGEECFYGCASFTKKLTLNSGLKKICKLAFFNCKFTGELCIPATVEEIQLQAFYSTNFTTKNNILYSSIPTGETNYSKWCIGVINTSLPTGNIIIEDETIGLAGGAFINCTGITDVTFLYQNSKLKYISESSFQGCTGLTQALIPKSVIRIGANAYLNTSLKQTSNHVIYSQYSENLNKWCLGYVSSSAKPSGNLSIEDNTVGIIDNAFYQCTNLTAGILIRKELKYLGNYAFYGCNKLNYGIDFEANSQLTTIGDSAFEGCSELQRSINFNNAPITKIGDRAFANCSKLCSQDKKSLELPKTLTYLGSAAFANCTTIPGKLSIPVGITEIKKSAFENCSSFTAIEILGDITNIAENAFKNCTGLSSELKLPESLTNIDDEAFENCSNLIGNLVLPDKINRIGDNAFKNCSGFTNNGIKMPDEIFEVGNSAFQGCSKLSGELFIPESCLMIGTKAFYGDTFNSVKFIGSIPPLLGADWQPKIESSSLTYIFVPYTSEISYFEAGIGFNCENIGFIEIESFSVKDDYTLECETLPDLAGSYKAKSASENYYFSVIVNAGADSRATWQMLPVGGDKLPDWLNLNAKTGFVSWTDDISVGTYKFMLKATSTKDSSKTALTKTLTIKVNEKGGSDSYNWLWIVLPLSTIIPTGITIGIVLWLVYRTKKTKKNPKKNPSVI